MIICVGGQKGGSGKSCISQNLSIGLAKKNKDILLIDADPQRTSADWAEERDDVDHIKFQATSGDITDITLALADKFDHIIIDCGGRDTKELRSAMIVADIILVPLRPKRRDLKTLDYISDLIEKSQITNKDLIARSVITQAPTLPSQYQRIFDAKQVSNDFGLKPLQSVVFQRNVFDDAEEEGLSVFEASDEKAQNEILNILEELNL